MSKRSRRHPTADLPVATIAAYGPDNTRATKLVVSIVRHPADGEPGVMRTWTTEADVRSDPHVAAEVAAFIAESRVKETLKTDRIIGCPHEEGVDYPMGRTCPRCPFWAGVDRFTHDPIVVEAASMSAADVLQALAEDAEDEYEDALVSADAHREALVGPLLDALDRGIADPVGVSDQDVSTFSYALYLLAKWREPRAYPHVIRWLSLPEEEPFEIAGDIVTQDGGRILASVCDGNLDPIASLIVNRDADEWGRSAGVPALALLAAWAEVPRAEVIDRLLWLVREGLERTPNAVWDSLAVECADIEALEIFPELRRAYDEGLIDPQCMGQSELDEVEGMPRGEMTRITRERHPPIDDVVDATGWWDREWQNDPDEPDRPSTQPYRAPAKVGRNEPCPCGSGKKYKKCCGK
jgi:hypothetical protein